jgi:hypothetical protein
MEFGVFIPVANDGWIMSETAPKYLPTFELRARRSRIERSSLLITSPR